MGNFIDLTGKQFGKLTVLENIGKIDGKNYYWKCQCSCGKIVNIKGHSLRSGNTKSCGCAKYDGLKQYNLQQSNEAKIPIGTRFGKLTVIEDLGFKQQIEGHQRRWYKCQCDCGNNKEVMGNLLKQGQVLSCGNCLKSKGELIISTILDNLQVQYNTEFIYPELVQETGRKLRFDFVVYNNDGTINRFIEFDGRQHYDGPDTTYWGHSKETKETIQEKDQIKNNFCLQHKIPLIRIPYWITPTQENLFSSEYEVKGE